MNKTVKDSSNKIRPFAKQKALFYFTGLMCAGIVSANQQPQSDNELVFESADCSIGAIQDKQKKYRNKLRNTRYFPGEFNALKNESRRPNITDIVNIEFRLIKTTPHDVKSYTQGLSYYNGYIYESTGGLGFSELRKLELETGKLIKFKKVADEYFAEGLAVSNNQLVQLTLKKNVAFIYDIQDLKEVDKFSFSGDGWGVVSLGEELIISDGTAELQRVSANNHQHISRAKVMVSGVELQGVNEMEYINGMIYANIWPTDCIAVIDPLKFNVEAWLDLSSLYPANRRLSESSVLNGIAYDVENKVLLVTGKNWPEIYHLKLNE